MEILQMRSSRAFLLAFVLPVLAPASVQAQKAAPEPVAMDSGWKLQDAAKVPQSGAEVSALGFAPSGWYAATVPGTVLTSLVNDHVYPEPFYGENNRPEVIPETLARSSYWYRTEIEIPKSYKNRHIWLNFDGINYAAAVWVNGAQVGTTRGAFLRGVFDITAEVKPGMPAAVAVLVSPQPHPGNPNEHTLRNGVRNDIGHNGGITAIDGPTFFCTIGWDWLPGIRDRDTGIWRKVFLSSSGPVLVRDPLVTTDLPLPRTDSTDVSVEATLDNVSDSPQKGTFKGTIENVSFEQQIELAPHAARTVRFEPKTTAVLHIDRPRLWWPNGYGPQNLYRLHLEFKAEGETSDAVDVGFGVRKITYSVPDSDNLTLSVNGVKVFVRGGNWGIDEGLKRIPRERLEAQIRMHQLANLNMIRNWVGQSTSEDFYELCDKYGILLWDEFFQPNPLDGPDPEDIPTYMANVRDKVLRFRNHPSIAIWCARNEGFPPKEIDDALRKLMNELEPTRRYQPSSTAGAGVRSGGPYNWRKPSEFYQVTDDFFKTETGSVSIPTLESIHGMMPRKDWETINDDWAEHDMARGAQSGEVYPGILAARYGRISNLADFVRKGQMANYEAFRAMYEGRNAQLFHPTTAVITWASNPSQPSFVWQIYHYDLEPNASLFAVKHAGEPVHIQFNQAEGMVQVIDNLPTPLEGAVAHIAIYNLDGTLASGHEETVNASPYRATNLTQVQFPKEVSFVHFLKLDLTDAQGKLLSSNFYWLNQPWSPDDFSDLEKMPAVELSAEVERKDEDGKRVVAVALHNTTPGIALMAHLQLRRASGERVLPAYASDNYVTLLPGESKTVYIEAGLSAFQGEDALVVVDGWNVTVSPASSAGVSIAPNVDAQPDRWPATGLPFQSQGLR